MLSSRQAPGEKKTTKQKSHRSLRWFSDLRTVTLCGEGTLATILTLDQEPHLALDRPPSASGLWGTAKLVGVVGVGLWKRLLARSSRTRSGSGRSASESLPLSES